MQLYFEHDLDSSITLLSLNTNYKTKIVKAFLLGTHKQGFRNRFENSLQAIHSPQGPFTAWDNMQINGHKCVSLEQSGPKNFHAQTHLITLWTKDKSTFLK